MAKPETYEGHRSLALGTILLSSKRDRFVLIDHRPYTRADGTLTELTVWMGRCAICSEPFEQTGPCNGPNSVVRTCETHRGQIPQRGRFSAKPAKKPAPPRSMRAKNSGRAG